MLPLYSKILNIKMIKGIKTIEDLTRTFKVQTGDLIMCTYSLPPWEKEVLDLVVGLYNPFQGIDGGAIGPSHVDLFEGAQQRQDLVKSNSCFRVHLLGYAYGDKSNLWNDERQVQVPVGKIHNFKVVEKAENIKKFFKNSC